MAIATAPGIRAEVCSDITLRVAATRDDREAAFRLIYKAYERAGLCEENCSQMRFTPYQLLSTTDLFVAQLRGETISTMSLVHDGELGLPMESIYPEEIRRRRAAGVHLAEVSCLADRRSGDRRFLGVFCDLARLMAQSARYQQADQLLITVHPRHAGFYRRYLGFRVIGSRRDYDLVGGNPALPLCLDLNAVHENSPARWEKFFGKALAPEVIRSRPISAADRAYFLGVQDAAEGSTDDAPCLLSSGQSWSDAPLQRAELLCA